MLPLVRSNAITIVFPEAAIAGSPIQEKFEIGAPNVCPISLVI